jgi:hypothetical protein
MIIVVIVIFVIVVFILYDSLYTPRLVYSKEVYMKDDKLTYHSNSLIIQEFYNGRIWATRGYSVYSSPDGGKTFEFQFKVPIRIFHKGYLGNSGILREIFDLHDIVEIKTLRSSTKVIFGGGSIFRLVKGGKYLETTGKLRLYGRNQGRGITPQGITEDLQNNIYYGEYARNPNRDYINIYRSNNDGETWKVFYTFPQREIRHVHAVQYDKYENKIWVATGDGNNESKIGFFKPGNSNLHILFTGEQKYRAVGFLFTEDYVYWGTDSNRIENVILRYHRSSGNLEEVCKLDGPAFYSNRMSNNNMVVGTTPPRKQKTGKCNSSIWLSRNGTDWSIFMAEEKNKKNKRHAHVRFPRGEDIPTLMFTYLHTQQFHKKLIVFSSSLYSIYRTA